MTFFHWALRVKPESNLKINLKFEFAVIENGAFDFAREEQH